MLKSKMSETNKVLILLTLFVLIITFTVDVPRVHADSISKDTSIKDHWKELKTLTCY